MPGNYSHREDTCLIEIDQIKSLTKHLGYRMGQCSHLPLVGFSNSFLLSVHNWTSCSKNPSAHHTQSPEPLRTRMVPLPDNRSISRPCIFRSYCTWVPTAYVDDRDPQVDHVIRSAVHAIQQIQRTKEVPIIHLLPVRMLYLRVFHLPARSCCWP